MACAYTTFTVRQAALSFFVPNLLTKQQMREMLNLYEQHKINFFERRSSLTAEV